MERKLVTIQTIEELRPIAGADRIESARVRDWWVVVKKGEFKVGDPCVYFEIDSLLPDIEMYEFLKRGTTLKRMLVDGQQRVGIRLKTIKLKGTISQGLALPISIMPPEFTYVPPEQTGMDVTEILGVIKYEQPIPAELAGLVKGFFPGFLRKTDEERVQNLGPVIDDHQGQEFYITEKLDGSSMSVYKKDGLVGVCSRNLELKESETNSLWKLANQFAVNLPNDFAIQGEIVGEGVNGNNLKLTGQEFYAYNVWDIKEQKYFSFHEFRKFCADLGVKTVPIIDEKFVLDRGVEGLLNMADGKSFINPEVDREGLVFRPIIESTMQIGNAIGRLSFKVISNAYLLGESE